MVTARTNQLTAAVVTAVVILAILFSGCAPAEYEIKTEIEPQGGGETAGSGIYQEGDEVTVEAEPAENLEFVAWEIEGEALSAEKSHTFTAERDKTLTAIFEEKPPEELSLVYETGNDLEGEIITVIDEQDNVVFEYSFDQFRSWADENWENVFEEVPAFIEEKPVNPEDLMSSFDQTAAISPGNDRLAFSVHSYFTATFMSFVGVVDLETRETELVDAENRGQVEELIWSPEGTYLAYTLHTAKAERFFLSNDNTVDTAKNFTLAGEELAEAVEENGRTLPHFRDISWDEEDKRLHFTADIAVNDTTETADWSINPDGTDLRKE